MLDFARRSFVQPTLEVGRGQALREKEALCDVTTRTRKLTSGGLGLDALRDHPQPERVREPDRRADDRRGARVLAHVITNDLSSFNSSIGNSRNTPARNTRSRNRRRRPEYRVPQFASTSRARCRSAIRKSSVISISSARRRQVTRAASIAPPAAASSTSISEDADRLTATDRTALPPPRRHLIQGLLEHAGGQLGHQAGVLDDRQEPIREQQTLIRVLPAHQRFDAADLVRARIHLRLVMQDEGALDDGGPQQFECAQPVDAPDGMSAVPLKTDCPEVVALRLVHRDVRVPQQRRHVARVRGREGDADTRLRPDGDAVEHERRGDPFPDVVRQRDGDVLGGVGEQHGEFVTAEPDDQVSRRQVARRQPARNVLEHLVTGVVPEAVVDLLEAVEVEQQQADDLLLVLVTARSGSS